MTAGTLPGDPQLNERIAHLPADRRAQLLARLRTTIGRTGHDSPWFIPFTHRNAARVRLFCFPYAGGGASMFRGWRDGLPPDVDVVAAQLPGRENRVTEPPVRRMDQLIDALHEAIAGRLDLPFAFYGHSMGALVAYELAQRLRRAGAPEPAHLFLAAFRAPQLPNPNIKIYHMPDEVLKTVLRTEGTPQHILDNEDIMRALLPTLRADIELCDTYVHRASSPLRVPMSVFGGHQDIRVSPSDLEPWRDQAGGPFRLTMIPGSHFFLHSGQDLLLGELARDLDTVAPITEGAGHDRPTAD